MTIIKNKYFIITLILVLALIIGFGLMEIALSGGNGNGNGPGDSSTGVPGIPGAMMCSVSGTPSNSDSTSDSTSDGDGTSIGNGNGSVWIVSPPPPTPPPPPPPTPPICAPSCETWSVCSVSCGGGIQTRTCTATDCSTYTESQPCNTQPCPPTLTFTAVTPYGPYTFPVTAVIAEGQFVNLNWTSTDVNPNGCTASGGSAGWPGANYPSNDNTPSYTYTPGEGIYTYYLDCDGPGGSVQSRITVQVRKPVLVLSVGSKICSVCNLSWAWQDAFTEYLNQIQFYRLYRDGILIANNIPPIQSTYQDLFAFTSGQTYVYRVEAIRSAPPTPVLSLGVDAVPCPALPGWREIIPR